MSFAAVPDMAPVDVIAVLLAASNVAEEHFVFVLVLEDDEDDDGEGAGVWPGSTVTGTKPEEAEGRVASGVAGDPVLVSRRMAWLVVIVGPASSVTGAASSTKGWLESLFPSSSTALLRIERDEVEEAFAEGDDNAAAAGVVA